VAVASIFLSVVAVGQQSDPAAAPPAESILASFLASFENALAEAIAKAEGSVVAIARVPRRRANESTVLEFRPDPFGRRLAPFIPSSPSDPDYVPSEYGAGVIVDRAGRILTAYHVLGEDSDQYDYFVTVADRRTLPATPLAADPRSDLAVLQVPADNLQPIQLGDAKSLQKGHFVIALGNPFAIARDGQASASWGIVANLQRKAPPRFPSSESGGKPTLHHFGTLIQTDAKLNWGTSGGALINLKGEMVGLLTALPAVAGYEQAAGYAYPVDDMFRRALEALLQGREVEYGFLGVSPINLTPEETLRGGLGARVDRIVPGTPAEFCGLRPGDVVVSINGTPVYDADSLVLEVGRLPVESRVRIEFVRDGRTRQIEAVLTKYPVRGKKIITTPPPTWRGVRVDYASVALDSETGLTLLSPIREGGVLVTEVARNSAAWQAGLRPGMLVLRVESQAVTTPRQFFELVANKSREVKLAVRDRPGGSLSELRVPPP